MITNFLFFFSYMRVHPENCQCFYHRLNLVARQQLQNLLNNEPHHLLEGQLKSIIQGFFDSFTTLNKELSVSESRNAIARLKLVEMGIVIRKDKKAIYLLDEKIDSLYRRKAVAVQEVKKENRKLVKKLRELKFE